MRWARRAMLLFHILFKNRNNYLLTGVTHAGIIRTQWAAWESITLLHIIWYIFVRWIYICNTYTPIYIWLPEFWRKLPTPFIKVSMMILLVIFIFHVYFCVHTCNIIFYIQMISIQCVTKICDTFVEHWCYKLIQRFDLYL